MTSDGAPRASVPPDVPCRLAYAWQLGRFGPDVRGRDRLGRAERGVCRATSTRRVGDASGCSERRR